MTDNTHMVDLPWVDGTTRTVPEGTVYQAVSGTLLAARDGGYSDGIDPNEPRSEPIHPHIGQSAATRIFTEAPEPPVKVNVPTSLGAIVSLAYRPGYPGFVLAREGWRGLLSGVEYRPDKIANELRLGARVLFEGVDKVAP